MTAGEFRAEHVVRSAAFTLELPRERAFEFFTPEGERAWAPGWEPRYLHPADGGAAEGMVFTTSQTEETIWMMLRYAPTEGRVEYLRLTPGSRLGVVRVECTSLSATRTRVNVSYELTALTEAGNATIRALDESTFANFIAGWPEAINRALAKG
jgi:hypothetical protein